MRLLICFHFLTVGLASADKPRRLRRTNRSNNAVADDFGRNLQSSMDTRVIQEDFNDFGRNLQGSMRVLLEDFDDFGRNLQSSMDTRVLQEDFDDFGRNLQGSMRVLLEDFDDFGRNLQSSMDTRVLQEDFDDTRVLRKNVDDFRLPKSTRLRARFKKEEMIREDYVEDVEQVVVINVRRRQLGAKENLADVSPRLLRRVEGGVTTLIEGVEKEEVLKRFLLIDDESETDYAQKLQWIE
jgi:hypothetical protein